MVIKIEKSRAAGTVEAPPSKSAAHRMLISAALSGKGAEVRGIEYSEDVKATLRCIEAMGVKYKEENGNLVFCERAGDLEVSERIFDCGESGSTLRFFIPIALTDGVKTMFKGTQKLLSRPLEVYEEIFKDEGIQYTHTADSVTVEGKLSKREYTVRGDVSSQFVTGLLFALSVLGGGRVNVTPPLLSRPYIEMTQSALKCFGINTESGEEVDGTLWYSVSGCFEPASVKVEGDWSSAAFLDALGMLGGDVTVGGLDEESLQGDKICTEYFTALDNGHCEIDISNCPDLGPILFTLAALKNGAKFTGTRRLSDKESDRAKVMKTELSKFGAELLVEENSVTVCQRELHAPTEMLCGHNDHRVVMSLSVICSVLGGEIDGCDAVTKSYPRFFDDLKSLGINISEINGNNKEKSL
jgi:3-phosphoshikimate 1-carboxyvinyltransferase